MSRPFDEALRGAVWTFTAKSSIQPTVVIEGALDDLTDTQRITLYRIAQEALSNVCDHSEATEVTVSLNVLKTHISLEISDNGKGFDVDWALMDASHRGRIGLLGMIERVRLIGGDLQIKSRPGATRLSVRLAHYRPAADTPAERAARLGLGLVLRRREAVVVRPAHRAGAVVHVELAVDVRQVELHRLLGDPQLLADLLVREAARERSDERDLPFGQPHRLRGRRRGAVAPMPPWNTVPSWTCRSADGRSIGFTLLRM